MKYFLNLTILLVVTLVLSACGAQAAPTAEAIDLQGTIAAGASTMIAGTQAAIPTATPPSPTPTFTDTPPPTNTPLPLPSSEVTFTSVPGGNSGGDDPCINKPLTAPLQGETVRMRIRNSTDAALSLTVYLNQTGPGGECGYRSYTLEPGQVIAVNDLLEGCYTLWAWNPVPDEYFIVTNGTNCLDNTDAWVFDISTRSITLGT
jgi:hypothetical protein